MKYRRLVTALLGLTIPCSPFFAADQQPLVELGSTEFSGMAKLPAAAGGNVVIDVRVTLKTSQDVVKQINEGIKSGQYQPPFGSNKEFMDLVLGSRPGSFEVEFLNLNKESRFYFFFEEQLNKVKSHKSIPSELKKRANELARNAKTLLYQTIKPNDFKGARILFEQSSEVGSLVFYGSTKRGNQLAGKVEFTEKERPIYDAMKKALTEEQPRQPNAAAPEYDILDDIIKVAQEKKILVTKTPWWNMVVPAEPIALPPK